MPGEMSDRSGRLFTPLDPAGRRFITGQSYGGHQVSNVGSTALTQNIEVASRFDVGKSTLFDQMSLYIPVGAASNVIRLGIRKDNGNCYPAEAVFLDAGTIDASVAGIKSLSISQILGVGRYWLSATLQGGTGASTWSRALDPFIASDAASAFGGYVNLSAVPGALPNTFGGPSAGAANGITNVPYILLRAA